MASINPVNNNLMLMNLLPPPDIELEAYEAGTILCDLSHLGVIKVSGEDASNFLQNQLSNDLQKVAPTQSQLSAYCTPKGRVFSLLRLVQYGECFFLQLPKERLEPTLKRLQMYILMSKTTLADAGDELISIGCTGKDAETKLKTLLGTLPRSLDECYQSDGLIITRLAGNDRFMVSGPFNAVSKIWRQLQATAQPVCQGVWELTNIHAGIPDIYDATAEAFVPQMLNLDLIGAVSFTKGCYPGQEIVARTRYLGKLKRRLYMAHIDGKIPPQPGDNLVANEAGGVQSVGVVISAALSPSGGFDCLTVIQIASAEYPLLHSKNDTIRKVFLKDLPYSVEVQEEND